MLRGGQEDGELRPAERAVAGLDDAAVVADDAVGRGQPQAGAALVFPGGEEGVEDPVEDLRVDAAAAVSHGDAHVTARRSAAGGSLLMVEVDVCRGQADLAAERHGVGGVDEQVEQHLLDLPGVDLHRPEARLRLAAQGDLPARLAEQGTAGGDQAVQVRHPDPVAGLPPGQAEQLPGELFSLAHVLLDVPQLFGSGRAFGQVHQQERGAALDAHEQVVEIVGNAAGQGGHGLEPLYALQLALHGPGLGDVAEAADEPGRFAVLAGVAGGADGHVEHAAVAGGPAGGQVAHRLARGDQPAQFAAGLIVVGKGQGAPLQLVQGPAEGAAEARVEVLDAAVQVVDDKGVGGRVEERQPQGLVPFRLLVQPPVARLTLRQVAGALDDHLLEIVAVGDQLLLLLLVAGDVDDEHQRTGDPAVGGVDRGGDMVDVHGPAAGGGALPFGPAAGLAGEHHRGRAVGADRVALRGHLVAVVTDHPVAVKFPGLAVLADHPEVVVHLPHGPVHDIDEVGQGGAQVPAGIGLFRLRLCIGHALTVVVLGGGALFAGGDGAGTAPRLAAIVRHY